MPELPVDEPIRTVPDWTCEILSKTTRRHDLEVKLPYYAKVGVACHWMVDFEARMLTAHRLESSEWGIIGTYSNETEARIPPFAAVPLKVASWWPPVAPKGSR
jgi:Uma2 family endonuclease